MCWFNPIEQFQVNSIFSILFWEFNFSFSNFALFLLWSTVGLLCVALFWLRGTKLLLVSGWQLVAEVIVRGLFVLLCENVTARWAAGCLVTFLVLFAYLLFVNLCGLVPYSFTATAHIFVTFQLALIFFIGLNIVLVVEHRWSCLCLFLPKNVPVAIVPLLVVIELISYVIKVFTLSIRLFANMTSGHTLLKVIGGFSWTMFCSKGFVFFCGFLPLGVLFLLVVLELGVALLQAYVFVLLLTIYLNDVLNLH